jgi:hypothetical protein
MNTGKRWWIVILLAAAMAWAEAAAVYYLRLQIDRVIPYQSDPLPNFIGLGWVELIREAATLMMLWAVGWLAGGTTRSRWAYGLTAFGAWDIFYYLFLIPISGWPQSLLDWDILFLIPLPWWGPVLAPVMIAALMVLGGTLISQGDAPDRPLWPRAWALGLNALGIGLALYAFMADAMQALFTGQLELARHTAPLWFNWPAFFVALALMAAPVADVVWQLRARRIPPMALKARR